MSGDARDAPSTTTGLGSLPGLLERAGKRRVLLVTGPSGRHAAAVQALLGAFEVEVFAGARRHVPEDVLNEARRRLDSSGADAVVALGGGSAIGVAKALRRERRFFFVAVPTTYAGSERTSLWGVTVGGEKTTGRDPQVRPDAVIHDVDLTLDMPRALAITSLMNALAHPLGALGTGSLAGAERQQAVRAFESVYAALEELVAAPASRRARAAALEAAGLAAAALEAGKPGLHHRLCHLLGGRFDLEHGALHSVLLPHSLHRLRAEAPDVVNELDRALGSPDLEASLHDLLVRAGAAVSLRALGVTFEALEALVVSAPELPRELLGAAFHGRRPSRLTRLEDWGLPQPVSVRGPPLAEARRVVVALHGRGATADGILGRAVEICGHDPTITVVAPQASNNVWYAARYSARRAEIGAELDAALAQAGAVLRRAVAEAGGAERVSLFGFSQGACLALDLFSRTPLGESASLASVVALSGASIGGPDEQQAPGSAARGTPILLGASAKDPWVAREHVEATARALAGAGCEVTLSFVPGEAHALHARHRLLARVLLGGRAAAATIGGFGGVHESESEALPAALPRDRNSPRRGRYGLFPEQLSGTGFVAPRSANRRTWTYRIRPSAQQGPFGPLGHDTFRADFAGEPPEANLLGFGPPPVPDAPADFVDGMVTLGGGGSPRLRRGFAVHVYAANRSMEERCFYDADGDLLLLPQQGSLTLLTELGVLDVAPGQVAVVPRGLRFAVLFDGSGAAEGVRGYVAEAFGRPFELPDRGPVGANGLADARHFRAPAAWHEDRLAPGYRVTAKVGGALYEAVQDYSPFDVVAWHGNHCPYVYDLGLFSPVGGTRIDHIDPSAHTVLTAPLDEAGAHALDLIVFPPRWDPTEGTFRPPYFHRNVTTEVNGIIRDPGGGPGSPSPSSSPSPFWPGGCFVTPGMTPHGVVAAGVERALALDDEAADRPRRSSDASLWFQLESALPFSLAPYARTAPFRIPDWPHVWGAYRSHFST